MFSKQNYMQLTNPFGNPILIQKSQEKLLPNCHFFLNSLKVSRGPGNSAHKLPRVPVGPNTADRSSGVQKSLQLLKRGGVVGTLPFMRVHIL